MLLIHYLKFIQFYCKWNTLVSKNGKPLNDKLFISGWMITCMFVCIHSGMNLHFLNSELKCMKSQGTESSEQKCFQAPCKKVLINEIFILFTPYQSALQPKLWKRSGPGKTVTFFILSEQKLIGFSFSFYMKSEGVHGKDQCSSTNKKRWCLKVHIFC